MALFHSQTRRHMIKYFWKYCLVYPGPNNMNPYLHLAMNDPQRSTALEWSVFFLLEGLNRFHGANLTLSSDVDQDTQMFGLHERPLTYQSIIS